jgi:LmbE family N-acetylglucosaminyl deacetylase
MVVMVLIAVAVWLGWRSRAYRSLIKYDPAQDYAVPSFGEHVEFIALRCTDEGFLLPSFTAGAVSGFLELMVESTLTGGFNEPQVRVEAGDFNDIQYFERGVRGRRFLNISRLLSSGFKTKQRVILRGKGLRWRSGWVRLYLSNEQLRTEDRIVVVAPHPDDAEIAAFGLYSKSDSTVVTVTAGDDSDRFDSRLGISAGLPRNVVARLRVWDSIFIPSFGGITTERAINLCYPDGQLSNMQAEPMREFSSRSGASVDYAPLRSLNKSSLFDDAARCHSWESLVQDLSTIFSRVQPSIIAAPLPLVDPNSDHVMTTLAVCTALRRCGLNTVRLFLYIVHNRWTELYPFGPAGGGVPLPPAFDAESIAFDTFYSHSLSPERQMWKGIALEAMHDIGEFALPISSSGFIELLRLKAILGSKLKGLTNPPTSYLRRAVRPDEVFFVISLEQAECLARTYMKQLQETQQ